MSDNKTTNRTKPDQYTFSAINAEKKFFDLPQPKWDPITYKVRKDSKHEFGIEYMKIVPSEDEVRLLGNRHRDCRYYSLGKI